MTANDLSALSSIYVRALENSAERWNEQSALALLSDWLRRQPDLAFVAEVEVVEKLQAKDSGETALAGGFVLGVRPWWDGNHLVDGELFVDPTFARRGIATLLLRHALGIAEAKYSPVVWDTYTFVEQGFPLNWYERLGFQTIDEWVMIRADVKQLIAKLG
jgi:GNAT superfamily N-acetyltransferase